LFPLQQTETRNRWLVYINVAELLLHGNCDTLHFMVAFHRPSNVMKCMQSLSTKCMQSLSTFICARPCHVSALRHEKYSMKVFRSSDEQSTFSIRCSFCASSVCSVIDGLTSTDAHHHLHRVISKPRMAQEQSFQENITVGESSAAADVIQALDRMSMFLTRHKRSSSLTTRGKLDSFLSHVTRKSDSLPQLKTNTLDVDFVIV
jgi:hypothetical protein